MKRNLAVLGAVAGAAFALTATAASAVTLKLNHNNPPEHQLHKSMEFMADRVKELTNGDVKIRVYANAQLGYPARIHGTGSERHPGYGQVKRFRAGSVRRILFSAMNLPYIFVSDDHYFDVLSGEIGDDVLMASKDKGFIGLTYYVEGARSFYANKEINSPADLKGMKIRVQPSESAIRMVELLGGNPTPISWGELYSALKQGVVDGAENNPTALTTARHGEVSKVYSNDGHTMIPSVVVISTKVWEGLGEANQKALKQAAKESMSFHREAWNKTVAAEIEKAKKELGVKFVEVEKGPFIEAVLPMHEEASAKSERIADLVKRIKASAK